MISITFERKLELPPQMPRKKNRRLQQVEELFDFLGKMQTAISDSTKLLK